MPSPGCLLQRGHPFIWATCHAVPLSGNGALHAHFLANNEDIAAVSTHARFIRTRWYRQQLQENLKLPLQEKLPHVGN